MFAPYFPIEEKRRKRASDWHFQFWTLSFVGVWELHAKLLPSVPRRRGSPNFHLISASIENLPGPKTRTISAQIKGRLSTPRTAREILVDKNMGRDRPSQ